MKNVTDKMSLVDLLYNQALLKYPEISIYNNEESKSIDESIVVESEENNESTK